jgi:hypothetical protein
MNPKVVITKPGYNALIAQPLDNKVFDSRFGTLKYFDSGQVNLSFQNDSPSYNALATYTHNLGYRPFVECYTLGFDGVYQPVPLYGEGASTSWRYGVAIDENVINFFVETNGFSVGTVFDIYFYYFLFNNKLGL